MSHRARLPIVTLILIAANLIAAFAVVGFPDLISRFGFHPDSPSVRTAVTSLFLHANILHLLGNMVFLAAVGSAVESASGSFRFASVYFLSGLVGVVAHYFVTRNISSPPPEIGASGAIAGCAGYYAFRYYRMKVPVWPGVQVSVLLVTGLWALLQLVGAFVRLGESSGTAFWAHLGGFATGILLSQVFRAPELGEARLGHALIDEMGERGPGAVVTTALLHLSRHPKDPVALDELARAYSDLNDVPHETDALFSLLEVAPTDKQEDVLRRIVGVGKVGQMPAWRRTMLAEKCKESDRDLACKLLESVVQEADEPQRPEAMLALVGLERDVHPDRAEALLAELSRLYPLHPALDVARKRGWVS